MDFGPNQQTNIRKQLLDAVACSFIGYDGYDADCIGSESLQ